MFVLARCISMQQENIESPVAAMYIAHQDRLILDLQEYISHFVKDS